MKNKILGKMGEDIAVQKLKQMNFEILDRNFTIQGGEIDIIAKKDNSIHFIEVKTRKNEYWQNIEETISDKKLEFIKNTAEEWFFRKKWPETFWQIDFIGIIIGSKSKLQKFVFLEDL